MLKRILLLIAFLLLPAASWADAMPEPSTREEFEMFWEKYTQSLSNPDPNVLLAMVEFPFTTKGELTLDPERTYDPQQFKQALPLFLQSDVPTTELPTPMSEYLKQKQVFSDQDILAGDLKVGNFKFHKVRGAWKWYFSVYDPITTP